MKIYPNESMTADSATRSMTVKTLKKQDKIRVMLVDDHPAFRTGMAALIENEPDLKVVAEAGDGQAAIRIYREKKPDVVLMDLRLPGIGGRSEERRVGKER